MLYLIDSDPAASDGKPLDFAPKLVAHYLHLATQPSGVTQPLGLPDEVIRRLGDISLLGLEVALVAEAWHMEL